MKKGLVFLWVVCMRQCFMYACGELWRLHELYSRWQGRPESWAYIYKDTNIAFKEILAYEQYRFDNHEQIGLWAFLRNRSCLINFLNSKIFKDSKDIYEPWLKNIFLLAHKASLQFKQLSSDDEQFDDAKYKNLLNGAITIDELCSSKEFIHMNEAIAEIFQEGIDWED